MLITQKEIKRIANLSGIILSNEEVDMFEKDLEIIINYFGKIKKVETKNIYPTIHPNIKYITLKTIDETPEKTDNSKLINNTFNLELFNVPNLLN